MFNQREFLKESMETFKTDVKGIEILFNKETLVAAVFYGKKSKPDWKYNFKSEIHMLKRIDDTIKAQADRLIDKEQQKIKDKEMAIKNRKDVKVGDLFSTSWGYDNTYVDFFQVIEKPSQASVIIRQINKVTVSEEFMSARVQARPNSFISEPKKCQIDKYGNVTKADDYGHRARKTTAEDTHHISWGY